MKKILSIILCVALVFGMVPAAFATTTGEKTETLEYVFSSEAAGGTSATYDSVETAGISKNKWASAGYNWHYGGTLANDLWYITMQQVRVGVQPVSFGVKIHVDKTGLFAPKLEYLKSMYGAKLDMYIVNAEDVKPEWDMETSNSKATLGMGLAVEDYIANGENSVVKKLITSKNTYYPDTGADQAKYDLSEVDYAEGEPINFEKTGDYYVIFGVSGADESALTSGSKSCYYIRLSKLTFTKLTPASVEVSADATELDAGGSTKLTSVVKTSDGTEIPAKVNYSSSNANVSVDAEGNVTAGSAPGTAIITATVDGTTISDTITIKVTKSYNYAFYGTETTGDWNQEGASYGLVSASIKKSWLYLANEINAEGNHNTNAAPFKIRFEEKGIYVPTITVNPYVGGGIVSVYLLPATWVESGNSLGDDGILNVNTEVLDLVSSAKANNKLIGSADTYSEAEGPTAANKVPYTLNETEITEDEYYLLFSITGNHPDAQAYVTKYTGFYAYLSSLSFKKVGEVQNVEAPTVALAVDYGTGEPTITSYPRGKEITLTAPEISGKTFRHWVRGTADGGSWVSSDETFSFTLATNTYLTAIYTEDVSETDKLVEFFGGNGEYITQARADESGKVQFPGNPKMTGFEFSQWIVAKDSPVTAETVFDAPLTRVVAEFVDSDTTFEVEGELFAYDTLIRKEEDSEKAWYRDGVLVGYGKTYDYHVWDSVSSIEARDITDEKLPVVVLDGTVKEDNACMIEYDTAGKSVTEVGIVFGTQNATIDSCNSKATSQKKLSHGQFTAKPNANGSAAYARGYIIYNDAGVYRVTYTEPVALNS